jgi:hypothetical protein
MYLPLSLDIPIFIGGLIRHFFGKPSAGMRVTDARDAGILFGSGLIAGEALMGILLAIPISLHYELPALGANTWVSLLIFGSVPTLYAVLVRLAGNGP